MMSGTKQMGRRWVGRAVTLSGAVALAVLALPNGLVGVDLQGAETRGPAQPVVAVESAVAVESVTRFAVAPVVVVASAGVTMPAGLVAPAAVAAPAAWAQEGPADSLYKAAREALNRGEYSEAARLFKEIRNRYPESKYVPDSYYFEALALYKKGGVRNTREAVAILETQHERHPETATSGDAASLTVRMQAELAQRGDREAAVAVAEVEIVDVDVDADQDACNEEEVALRVAALHSLMQMESSRAEPILRKILERRDECSRDLRMNAVFIVAEQSGDDAEDMLLDVARDDPDVEVRRQAVFWLSEVASDKAVAALDSILNDPNSDPELQQQAMFAIAESGSERSVAILKQYIQDSSRPGELRAQAIFWLGDSAGEAQVEFMRELYVQVDDSELRNQIFFVISQIGGDDNVEWLVERALDPNESEDVRQQAIFFAGEAGVPTRDLVRIYDEIDDADFRQHLIFVLAEREDDEAIDKIVDIARNDPDPDVRRQAVFWLSETGDPRAEEILMEILEQ